MQTKDGEENSNEEWKKKMRKRGYKRQKFRYGYYS